LLLVGCNAVFGNDRVGSAPNIDARFFDAPLDAPPACPGAGSPTFRAGLFQVDAPDACTNFSVAENGAILAVCPGTGPMLLYAGTVADGLRLATTDLPATDQPLEIRIAPEGDFAIIQLYVPTSSSMMNQTHALRIDPATSIWHDLGSISVPLGFLSTPTRAAPDRHMLLYDLSGDQFLDFVGDGVAWTQQPPYTTSPTSGFHSINNSFALTPDGLRIVANASPFANGLPQLLYGVRSDLESPFTDSSPLDEASSIQQPALSEDCGELFFIAIDRILYVKQ
jgi:hypothetical protein